MSTRLCVALLAIGILTLVLTGAARASLPLTQSRPYQAVCESQGGTFSIAIDNESLYCDKEGPLFTAFTDRQLHVQRTLCKRVYLAPFFGIQGFILPGGVTGTGTFCSIST